MKKFLSKISFFIFLIIALSILLDLIISNLLKQSNQPPGEFEVMNDIYSGKAKCDIAIYGSSRALHHLNPEILEDSLNLATYNFGMEGHNFWLQYMRHLEFLKSNPKPKIIILSADWWNLQKRKDLYEQNQFLPYMLWNKTIKNYTESYLGYSSLDYFIPVIRYYGRRSALAASISVLLNKDGKMKYRHKGFKGMNNKWGDFKNPNEIVESYEAVIDTASVRLFEQFILECKKSNIKLILTYTPEYIEGQELVSNRNEIINMYKDFAKKYNLLFLDYSGSELSYNKNLFYNSGHLNSKGADVFTRILAHDIKKSELQKLIPDQK